MTETTTTKLPHGSITKITEVDDVIIVQFTDSPDTWMFFPNMYPFRIDGWDRAIALAKKEHEEN